MRILPAEILAHIDDDTYRTAHLIQIDGGGGPYRWTNASFPLDYGGHTYTPQSFLPGEAVSTDDDDESLDIIFPDVTQIIRGIIYAEDWTYRTATFREVWLSMVDNTVIEASWSMTGRFEPGPIDLENESEPVTVTILPGAEAEGAPGPSQNFSGPCPYPSLGQFKGVQCGYAGAETACDGTVTRCRALGNEARFGGDQYAPAPGEVIRIGTGVITAGTRQA